MHVFFYTFVGDEDRTTKEYHVNVIYIFLGKNMMQLEDWNINVVYTFIGKKYNTTKESHKIMHAVYTLVSKNENVNKVCRTNVNAADDVSGCFTSYIIKQHWSSD